MNFDLKQGDKFFDVVESGVRSYRYLCIHPYNRRYHILIDEFQKPVRMYEKDLQEIINKQLKTNEDAHLLYITNLNEKIETIRSVFIPEKRG